ncbi:MAG: undecaprenyldiphospho-muramoylpentapeptide beta-N-acetylglucosaminyltransferase [Nitrospiraceae bacterium]|nr:MAG: undecaprenyldiphospho-muramoylpentapeptide beta-N-acetylglucosaminyltransferase [Nitrospiraceae bacterium]
MKVMIAGGGTGGHLFPGLALAEEVRKRDEKTEVVFVGTEHGIEARVLPREGYPLRFVRAEGFVGKSLLRKVKSIGKMFLSILDSYRILNAVKPDIVIGVGGYASGAVVLIAHFKSIPTMIHEQNSVPGTANRILGRFVDHICVTYQESLSVFPMGKTFLTGNPIRSKILRGEREAAMKLFSLDKEMFTVFVFGGSSGAASINRAMVSALNSLGEVKTKIQFLHQTGEKDYESVREAYRKAGFKGTVAPFIYQMAEAYAVADMVISRAGATTLAEITALGKPALLIPYPYSAGRHQEFNAIKLREMGAAFVVFDNEMNGEVLAKHIREMLENEATRNEMQRASRGLGRPEACGRIIDIAFSLVRNYSSGRRQKKGG